MRNKEFALPVAIGALLTVAVSVVVAFWHLPAGLLTLAMGLVLIGLFAFYTKRRYDKIADLNTYLSRVVGGDFSLELQGNAEGELSILQNNLLKVITMLKTSNEAVQKDKIYLADALADISHQLKTPLTSMTVITDLLKEEAQGERVQSFVGIMETQCEKMTWLITTLLKLSKLDAGTVEFREETVQIEEVLKLSLAPFMLTMDLRNIELIQTIKPFTVTGDKNWCAEAMGNIVKNCLEHTADGGRLTLCTDTTPLYHQLTVSDNGSGIASADLPHIFERFYHGQNAGSDSVGIGLALSKEILKKQNASISVESKEGEGTVFMIRFYKSII